MRLPSVRPSARQPNCSISTSRVRNGSNHYTLHPTACGRICIYRKRINLSIVLAGQRVGIKEVDDGIWIVTFMRYDLGFIDLEQQTLQPIDNLFGTGL